MALRETKTSDTRELLFEHLLVHFPRPPISSAASGSSRNRGSLR
jgi:hypothetical protein